MADQDFVERAIAHNDIWLGWLSAELTRLGLEVTPSVGNFVLVHFPADGARNAHAADSYLQDNGFVVRRMDAYGLPGALRITVGTQEANHGLVACLKALRRTSRPYLDSCRVTGVPTNSLSRIRAPQA